jgi:WXXGXW repeat (2 copies)
VIASRLLLIAPLSAAALLSGCVVAPYPARRAVYTQPVPAYSEAAPVYADDAVVDVAPPAPYVEVRPVLPYAGAVWIGGYWGWRGGRHAWVPGYYERPRPGYAWRGHGWVNDGGRWHLRGGGWYRF